MTDTRQEALIREAIAAEADQAVDHRTVLANLHGKRPRRRPFALFAAAGLTAAAAAVAVVVPLTVNRDAAPPAVDPAAPPAATSAAGRTVLLIGLDGAANTDSVVLARVGQDGTVSAASLPRDSIVDIPGAGRGKLNSAYAKAHASARADGRDGDAAGAQALAQTVEELTGVEVDHYAAVDMARFAALSDAVGGVPVCLRRPVRDEFSGIDLPAGVHSLRGEQALAFLRQRHGLVHGDLDRIVRHQVFLRSLAAKVLGAGDPARVAEAAGAAVRVDPGLNLVEFARALGPSPALRTAIIPLGEVVAVDQGQGFSIDPAAVRAFTAEFFADGATGTPTGGHSIPVPATETRKPGEPQSERDCVN